MFPLNHVLNEMLASVIGVHSQMLSFPSLQCAGPLGVDGKKALLAVHFSVGGRSLPHVRPGSSVCCVMVSLRKFMVYHFYVEFKYFLLFFRYSSNQVIAGLADGTLAFFFHNGGEYFQYFSSCPASIFTQC